MEMAASIGEQLRLAREERGIGLREISDQTRISVHYLEAIETNDYKRLPGGIFNRSFMKAYAKCMGYDEREAIEGYTRYLREHGESADDINTTPLHSKVYTDTPATRSPVLTVLLAILILAILTAAALPRCTGSNAALAADAADEALKCACMTVSAYFAYTTEAFCRAFNS